MGLSAQHKNTDQEQQKISEGMEELLLPSGKEEPRSGGRDSGRTVGDRLRTLPQVVLNRELLRNVRSFCKRNGLLTLSVIAVATGCLLGFMLRGSHMSTQVRLTCRTSRSSDPPPFIRSSHVSFRFLTGLS